MDAFVRKYQGFIVSLFFALGGIAALVYSAVISPAQVVQADMAQLVTIIQAENTNLSTIKKKAEDKEKTGNDRGIEKLPDFLRHINAIANATSVYVDELEPSQSGDIKFTIKLKTDFRTFIKFIQQLESLDVTINDMQIHPYDPTKKEMPVHFITFTITPRHNADEIHGDRITALQSAIAAKELRNPFQRFAYDPNKKAAVMKIDLTWEYKLSGIGQIGTSRIATIDSKDYSIGEFLGGDKKIDAVEADHVELSRPNGNVVDQYILKFRH